MISDTELKFLSALVPSTVGANQSLEDVMSSLSSEIAARSIPANGLEFESPAADMSQLDGIIVLAKPSDLPSHAKFVENCIALSGSGDLYNGMYGDGSVLTDPYGASAIAGKSHAAAPIAAQVAITIRLLESKKDPISPALAGVLRKHLSEILLSYPVLIHPSILMPSFKVDGWGKQSTEYSSVSSALASSARAGLPRLSHFEESARVNDSAISESLASFASHPCVILSNTAQSLGVRLGKPSKIGRSPEPKITKETLLRTLVGTITPRVEFLASIMELDDIRRSSTSTPDLPFLSTTESAPHLRPQLLSILATSASAAAGMDYATNQSTSPDSMSRHPYDAKFLSGLRNRIDAIFNSDPANSQFSRNIVQGACRRVFLAIGDDRPAHVITHNTRCILDCLTECGLAADKNEATKLVVSAILGTSRPEKLLPRADTTAAIAFLKAILPSTGSSDEIDINIDDLLNSIQKDITTFPSHQIPYRESWSMACDVIRTEHAMMVVINRSRPNATASEDPSPQRRRARALI